MNVKYAKLNYQKELEEIDVVEIERPECPYLILQSLA